MAERSEARTASAARRLGSWVRNPLETRMYVRVFLCYVVLCVRRGLESGRSPVQGVLQLSNRFISFRKILSRNRPRGLIRERDDDDDYVDYNDD